MFSGRLSARAEVNLKRYRLVSLVVEDSFSIITIKEGATPLFVAT